MKPFAALCVLFVMFASIGGCASSSTDGTSNYSTDGTANDSADGLGKQQIALMNELAEALEKNAPDSTLDALEARSEELKKKMEALKLSKAEWKMVSERNKDMTAKAAKRLNDAMKQNSKENKGK